MLHTRGGICQTRGDISTERKGFPLTLTAPALTDIGYDSLPCIEVEDKAFEGTKEKILDSLRLSYRYMSQFVI